MVLFYDQTGSTVMSRVAAFTFVAKMYPTELLTICMDISGIRPESRGQMIVWMRTFLWMQERKRKGEHWMELMEQIVYALPEKQHDFFIEVEQQLKEQVYGLDERTLMALMKVLEKYPRSYKKADRNNVLRDISSEWET